MEAADLFDVPGRDKYEIEEEVGHGTYSEVHRARHRTTGELVALKHMYLQEDGVLPKHVQRELSLLRAVRHPGVVALREVLQQGFSVALVLEHCLTDLRTLLARQRGTPLDLTVAKAVAQQLLQALAAVHAAGFVHRDVATSNVLIASDGTARLADFGQARRLPGSRAASEAAKGGADGAARAGAQMQQQDEGEQADEDVAAPALDLTPGSCLCTRWYKAPELLFNARRYGQGVDLWSAGCILAELLTGRALFPGTGDIGQLALMADLLGTISEERWPGVAELPDWGKLIFKEQPLGDLAAALGPAVPPEAVQLVASLVQYNPDHRLTAEQALQSPWFTQEPLPAAPHAVLALVRQVLDD